MEVTGLLRQWDSNTPAPYVLDVRRAAAKLLWFLVVVMAWRAMEVQKHYKKNEKNDENLVELWAFKGDFWYVDYPNFSRAYAQRRKSWLLRGSLHQESTQVPTAMFCGEMGPPLYADYVSAASLLCMIQAAPSKRGAW